jgi:hypothetical protein
VFSVMYEINFGLHRDCTLRVGVDSLAKRIYLRLPGVEPWVLPSSYYDDSAPHETRVGAGATC